MSMILNKFDLAIWNGARDDSVIFCPDTIAKIRDMADSYKKGASAAGDSLGFNRHTPETAAGCQRYIGESLLRYRALNKLADLWESQGVPLNHWDILDCVR